MPQYVVYLTQLQFPEKDQQESHANAGKSHDVVVKFDTYQNLKWHHVVLPAIARLSCIIYKTDNMCMND